MLNRQAIRTLLALEMRVLIECGQNSNGGRHGPFEVDIHTLLPSSFYLECCSIRVAGRSFFSLFLVKACPRIYDEIDAR